MHFFVKLVLAAPASFFSAALASHAVLASPSHFLTKLFLAAPASFFSAAIAVQLPPAAMGVAIAPLAAMPGASLCEVANAEAENASARAADSEMSCFMNVSGLRCEATRQRGSRRNWTTRPLRAARSRKLPQRRPRPPR